LVRILGHCGLGWTVAADQARGVRPSQRCTRWQYWS
jgi:hypothetical protein